jgi:hypothetical protein
LSNAALTDKVINRYLVSSFNDLYFGVVLSTRFAMAVSLSLKSRYLPPALNYLLPASPLFLLSAYVIKQSAPLSNRGMQITRHFVTRSEIPGWFWISPFIIPACNSLSGDSSLT